MVTRFSDLTLDNTPGAGSYVPYVDPTEAVAAERNKRLSLTPRLFAITGYTATKPPAETIVATYADIAAFETAVVPAVTGEVVQLLNGSRYQVLESSWFPHSSSFEWIET